MFEMPNYTRVGRVITKLARSYHFNDEPLYDIGIADDIQLETDSFDLLIPELGLYLYPPHWDSLTPASHTH
jgi:hypothetical protein